MRILIVAASTTGGYLADLLMASGRMSPSRSGKALETALPQPGLRMLAPVFYMVALSF